MLKNITQKNSLSCFELNMKVKFLRKLYPYINSGKKNIRWRRLTDAELDMAMREEQRLCTCYSESTRYALLSTDKGRELLRKRIMIEKDGSLEPSYKIKLNVNGKDETYRTDRYDYFGKYMRLYEEYYEGPLSFLNENNKRVNISLAMNIAISKMIAKHPTMKSVFSRIYKFPLIRNTRSEFNKPSKAFEWFTGKPPIAIGENSLNLNLKKDAPAVFSILNSFEKGKSSFVVMSANKKINEIDKWHCLPVTNVNREAKTVDLLNKRGNIASTFSFDDIINNFKAIIGMDFKS